MLKTLPRFSTSNVVRSRDPEVLDACDIIVDVGGKYDGEKYFDHHQRSFNDVLDVKHSTKLSSAGLVYKHFGKDVITSLSGLKGTDGNMDLIYNKVYDEFIEGIDANDNGISAYDSEPNFKPAMSLPQIIATLNPSWNEPWNDAVLDQKFSEASELVGRFFKDKVKYFVDAWMPARSSIYAAISSRPNPSIVVFEGSMPWKDHLFTIEEEMKIVGQVKYVLYSDGSAWRIQAVPKSLNSFESRLGLPEQWRGLRDDKLSEESGIAGCIFVHASGFIGGNKTKEGAMEMAQAALQMVPTA